MTDAETRRKIYDALRNHPNGPREVVKLARHMQGNTELERTKEAQLKATNYVMEVFGGDVERFLDSYSRNEIGAHDIIFYTGRKSLFG